MTNTTMSALCRSGLPGFLLPDGGSTGGTCIAFTRGTTGHPYARVQLADKRVDAVGIGSTHGLGTLEVAV